MYWITQKSLLIGKLTKNLIKIKIKIKTKIKNGKIT
jgi:hypothetical protein